jgi:hypothetical protein
LFAVAKANACRTPVPALARTTGASDVYDDGLFVGELNPKPAEEIIAAAVSSVLIVIEVASTAALASGNRRAQACQYVLLL